MEIEIADKVKHHPSGEEWIIARVTGKDVYPCGWPPCIAQLSDCELIEKASQEQRDRLIEELKQLPRNDSRHITENQLCTKRQG
jgi:hypothetical protein